MREEVSRLRRSLSWRLTAPLRAIAGAATPASRPGARGRGLVAPLPGAELLGSRDEGRRGSRAPTLGIRERFLAQDAVELAATFPRDNFKRCGVRRERATSIKRAPHRWAMTTSRTRAHERGGRRRAATGVQRYRHAMSDDRIDLRQ